MYTVLLNTYDRQASKCEGSRRGGDETSSVPGTGIDVSIFNI